MRFAFVVYDDLTLLDFSGIYYPITRLKSMGFIQDLEYDVCAFKETVRSFEGLELRPNKINNNLSEYDYVFLPGGNGIMSLLNDNDFLTWIRGISSNTTMTAVCGGTLLLGAAGLLNGKRATTHPMLINFLNKYTDNVSDMRIVEDGNIITARGVAVSIDLGLYLCEKIAGIEVRTKIQKQMDYLAYNG
jgi:cyclohexyl-isocyanide hydratase